MFTLTVIAFKIWQLQNSFEIIFKFARVESSKSLCKFDLQKRPTLNKLAIQHPKQSP